MEQSEVFLTNDGRLNAMNQLENLRTTKRAEVAQYLHEAKESGDVIDNAAYEDAKSEYARLEKRIYELEQLLVRAKPMQASRDEVSLGSVVHLQTKEDGREYHYTIVGPFESDAKAGRISNESIVGKALLGHKVGDLVIASAPSGVRQYTILAIE